MRALIGQYPCLDHVCYACSDWSISVFGSRYSNTGIFIFPPLRFLKCRPKMFSDISLYVIKELPNDFPCLDDVIKTRKHDL